MRNNDVVSVLGQFYKNSWFQSEDTEDLKKKITC